MINRLNRTDRILLFIACFLLVLFSYFLFDDSFLFTKMALNKSEKVGQILQSKNDVRHKEMGSFSWIPATKLEKLHQKDSLFTGPGSEASIELNDGSIIHISENSMITLNFKQGQLQLDLKYGDIVSEIKSTSDIQIKSGAEEYKLSGESKEATISLTRNRKGQNEIKAIKGKPLVVSKNTGEKLNLAQGTLKPLESKTTDTIVIPPKAIHQIDLITQNEMLVQKKSPKDVFELSWKGQGPFSGYKIIINKDSESGPVALDVESKNTNYFISQPLPEGLYSWKIQGLDPERKLAATSKSRTFYLLDLQPVEIISPKPMEVFTPPSSFSKLEWAPVVAEKFDWQISKDKSFSTILLQNSTTQFQVDLPAMEPGTYWARVRAIKKFKQNTEWSIPVPWNLTEPKLSSLPAPQLAKKNYELPPPKGRNPASIPKTVIQWKKVDKADSYLVEISQNPKFNELETIETEDVKFELQKYKNPTHFVRVRAKTKKGIISPYSDLAKITIPINRPVLETIHDHIEKSKEVGSSPKGFDFPINWEPVAFSQKYRVEISKNKEFTQSQSIEVFQNDFKFKTREPGEYYSRVRPIDQNGNYLTDYSNAQKFKYEFKVTLAPPPLLEPGPNLTIFLQKDIEPFLWLEWKPIARATEYEVQVAQDDSFKKILISSKSKSPKYLIKTKIPLGAVYWRVRSLASDPANNSDWSDKRTFKLDHSKNESFVE